MNNREVEESQIDDTAWCCRRLVVFVKRKTQKRLVGLVARLENSMFSVRILFHGS